MNKCREMYTLNKEEKMYTVFPSLSCVEQNEDGKLYVAEIIRGGI
jgi:hypothetical protein